MEDDEAIEFLQGLTPEDREELLTALVTVWPIETLRHVQMIYMANRLFAFWFLKSGKRLKPPRKSR